MRPFWTPQSALILADLGIFAPPVLLRKSLETGRRVELLYAGDRMWPAIPHGQRLLLEPIGGAPLVPGTIVVALAGGIPDLLRIESVSADRLSLCADADPADAVPVLREEVLGTVRGPGASGVRAARAARRLILELQEAVGQSFDPDLPPEETVRRKYERQAAFYASDRETRLDPALQARLRELVPSGGRILVAGSGAGRECLALEAEGWRITGIDFAEAMVESARREAMHRGSGVEYRLADLRDYQEPEDSLAAVHFTYEVYGFIRGRSTRVAMLKKMRGWLGRRGIILLSARMVREPYPRLLLTAQALRRRIGGDHRWNWGESHTRWITPGGAFSRAFIHLFTRRSLKSEVEEAGFELRDRAGTHFILSPRRKVPGAGTASNSGD